MDTSFTGTEFTQDADASGFIDNSRSASRVRGFSSFGLDFDDKPVNFIDQVAKENDETNKIE